MWGPTVGVLFQTWPIVDGVQCLAATPELNWPISAFPSGIVIVYIVTVAISVVTCRPGEHDHCFSIIRHLQSVCVFLPRAPCAIAPSVSSLQN